MLVAIKEKHPNVRIIGVQSESLQSKNQMLEKENIELKKQLDDISKNNPKQIHS